MLRLVVLIEGTGATRFSRSVVVLRADDFAAAKERAIALGRAMETSYVGGEGERVAWRLVEVETLDLLGAEITDGREVYSEPMDLPPGTAIAFDAVFDPGTSSPTHSGV